MARQNVSVRHLFFFFFQSSFLFYFVNIKEKMKRIELSDTHSLSLVRALKSNGDSPTSIVDHRTNAIRSEQWENLQVRWTLVVVVDRQ